MQTSNIKTFIIKIVFLAIILCIADFFIGKAMAYVVNNIKTGAYARDNYICNNAIEDILIFGSSRATRHYNSSIIEDSLGFTTYNCGEDGNGIISAYGRLLMLKKRHTPKIIIYDLYPQFDLYEGDNRKYLSWLKHRYEREGISNIFDVIDKNEKYKMFSNMYKYNSLFLQNLFTYLTGVSRSSGCKGFRPYYKKMDKMKLASYTPCNQNRCRLDSTKLMFLDKFISESKESKLIFVMSPQWYGSNPEEDKIVNHLMKNKGVVLIPFSDDLEFVRNDSFFVDGLHLNAKGADEFSKKLVSKLKNDILKN